MSSHIRWLILLPALLVPACAGPVPITPDAAGVAVETADTAFSLFTLGKAETHQPMGIDDCIASTRRAAEKLDLTLVREEPDPDKIKIVYRDMRKLDIVITHVRRTQTATKIKVDVGLFGDAGMGQLVLWQIVRGLPNRKPVGPETQGDATPPGHIQH